MRTFALTCAALSLLGGLVLFAMQPACNAFDLPTRECLAGGMTGTAPVAGEDVCQTCLQTRCCDLVGECQRFEGCAQAMSNTHACVLDGGRPRADEPLCTPLLRQASAADAAVDTYACLRNRCPAECGLPTCGFRGEVPLFQNAACDRCVESTCCEPVVACADDRRCKAALACITASCAGEIANVLSGAATAVARAIEREACEGAPSPDAGGPAPCIARCLDLYAPSAAPATPDDRAARCRAARALTCGSGSECGAQCSTFFTPPAASSSPDGG